MGTQLQSNSGVPPSQGHTYTLPADEPVTQMAKAIALIDECLNRATGLDPMSRKICSYYSVATHFVKQFQKFPGLNMSGAPGTGKSSTLGTMQLFCRKANYFTAKGMTLPSIRDELAAAHFGTAIIEEADDVQRQADFEGLLLLRYGQSTAKAGKKVPVPVGCGEAVRWEQEKIDLFGATIVHKREPFLDPALESRFIPVRTTRDEERGVSTYREPEQMHYCGVCVQKIFDGLSNFQLPKFTLKLGNTIQARTIDTWTPLLSVAQFVGDQECLDFAIGEMQKYTNNLKDGQSYEPSALVLQAMISALTVRNAQTEDELNWDRSVKVEQDIVGWIKKNHGRQITPWQAAAILREYGFRVFKSGGVNCVRPDLVTLAEACRKAGIEDELLTEAIKRQKR